MIHFTIGTLNGPSVPATAKDCDDPDSATRAVSGRWHCVVDFSSSCSLSSMRAARKTLVGEAQESIILYPKEILGSKNSSRFISSSANIMTWVQRKARRSNLCIRFVKNIKHDYWDFFLKITCMLWTYPLHLTLAIFLSNDAIKFSCLLKMGKIPPIMISPVLKILGISNLWSSWHAKPICTHSRQEKRKT